MNFTHKHLNAGFKCFLILILILELVYYSKVGRYFSPSYWLPIFKLFVLT